MTSLAPVIAPQLCRVSMAADSFDTDFGLGKLHVISDGVMQLPNSFLTRTDVDADTLKDLLTRYQMNGDVYQPDCNVSLWQHEDRLVLFDVGAGMNFMPGTGLLAARLEAAGLSVDDVTDVVFTHAHPDHLWGLLDDFDDILFPNASFHMHHLEREYWMADDTLQKTPENRKTFVVGAQNRIPLMDERLQVFSWGDEILPGIEAVDTQGHTPGHTSFVIHQAAESLLIVGDALTNIAISFEQPKWHSGADQLPDVAVQTRLSLLDRLHSDKTSIVGYHLPTPGLGQVARMDNSFRFVPV